MNVSKVKANFGTSNDGNTAGTFFENSEIAANITRLDPELVERFGVLLVIKSTSEIDVALLKDYYEETAQLYVRLYPDIPMSNTMHRLLVHGWSIIAVAPLSLGAMSEEAQEAMLHIIRKISFSRTMKCYRTFTMRCFPLDSGEFVSASECTPSSTTSR